MARVASNCRPKSFAILSALVALRVYLLNNVCVWIRLYTSHAAKQRCHSTKNSSIFTLFVIKALLEHIDGDPVPIIAPYPFVLNVFLHLGSSILAEKLSSYANCDSYTHAVDSCAVRWSRIWLYKCRPTPICGTACYLQAATRTGTQARTNR